MLKKAGGLHKFMGWNRGLLTDSGGFQMVSLLKLAEIDENGVNFESPFDGSQKLLVLAFFKVFVHTLHLILQICSLV